MIKQQNLMKAAQKACVFIIFYMKSIWSSTCLSDVCVDHLLSESNWSSTYTKREDFKVNTLVMDTY